MSPGQPETNSLRFQTGDRTSDIPGFSLGAGFEEQTFDSCGLSTHRESREEVQGRGRGEGGAV